MDNLSRSPYLFSIYLCIPSSKELRATYLILLASLLHFVVITQKTVWQSQELMRLTRPLYHIDIILNEPV